MFLMLNTMQFFFILSPKEAPLATQRVYSTVLTLQSTYMLWRKEYAVCSSGKGYSLKILQTLPQLLFPPDKWKWSRSRSKIQRQGINLKQSAIIPLEGRSMSYTAGDLLLRTVVIFRRIKIYPGYYFEYSPKTYCNLLFLLNLNRRMLYTKDTNMTQARSNTNPLPSSIAILNLVRLSL